MNLFLFDFVQRFAVDAQGGRRPCFRTLNADFGAALFAKAVIFTVDQCKRGINLFDQRFTDLFINNRLECVLQRLRGNA